MISKRRFIVMLFLLNVVTNGEKYTISYSCTPTVGDKMVYKILCLLDLTSLVCVCVCAYVCVCVMVMHVTWIHTCYPV